MNLFAKQKEIQRHRKQTYGYQKEKGRMDKLRLNISICTLLCIKQITKKDLLYSMENSKGNFIATYEEKESEK